MSAEATVLTLVLLSGGGQHGPAVIEAHCGRSDIVYGAACPTTFHVSDCGPRPGPADVCKLRLITGTDGKLRVRLPAGRTWMINAYSGNLRASLALRR